MEKKINKFLQEISFHGYCDGQKGDRCEHPHCRYSIMELKNNDYIRFTCGRPLYTILTLELDKPNKNNNEIIGKDNINA